jgi:hypothetical protein
MIKKGPAFMKPKGLLPRSQKSTTGIYPEQGKSSPHLDARFLKSSSSPPHFQVYGYRLSPVPITYL